MAGPDIFLSYNREDAERAKQFAEGFAAQGLNVWWDVALRSGEAYDEVTEDALHNAKAVVVLWSPRSVVSRWVRAEATMAERNKTLMPAMIETCRRPIMFELTQTAELSHWNGDTSDPAWQAFLRDVRGVIGKGPAPAPTPAAPTHSASAAPARPPVPEGELSVVVLPFTNMGGDPEQEYFADGITEDIITDLSKVSALSVISRNTAFTFKGKTVDVRLVSHQLGVTHVLEGSVRKAGNRVRITAQLIEGARDNHVWAERFDRDLDDIFELQDEISKAIVAALEVNLLPSEEEAIEKRGTNSLEAHDLYMRARAASSAALSGEDFLAARNLFKQTLEIDPDFSPALSGIAQAYHMLFIIEPEKVAELIGDFNALCDRSAARNPDGWGTQTILGYRLLLERNWSEALEAFEQAMAAAPSLDPDIAVNFAICLMNVGRVGDGIKVLDAARAVDPLSTHLSVYFQLAFFAAERMEDCLAEYERTAQISSQSNREDVEAIALFRVWLEGDRAATKAQLRRFLDAQVVPMPFLAQCAEVFDQPDAVAAVLRDAFRDPANKDGSRMSLMALHLALNGEQDLALAALRHGMVESAFPSIFLIWFPLFKELRQTDGFKQIVRDLGLYDYWRGSGNWGDYARPLGHEDFEIVA